MVMLCSADPTRSTVAIAASEQVDASIRSASVLRLSVEEALSLFLRQNLDVLVSSLGIDFAKGQQITARLFPNPVMSIGTLSSYTQGHTMVTAGRYSSKLSNYSSWQANEGIASRVPPMRRNRQKQHLKMPFGN